ncbi:hypothetical protein BJ508DRAFT_412795 [Ascobolus immersus RN42]|uniref:Uncharacterized protein n=1 Tax=Ascobolus immersus RN42 TaxID=1160509 RepID=A0A3N4IJV3_ASCIM|nr:hypothetical protein BJ508DRAFT_412795 [Ascobolus immersus RN42]
MVQTRGAWRQRPFPPHPTEIALLIASASPDFSTLRAFSQTCRFLRTSLRHQLLRAWGAAYAAAESPLLEREEETLELIGQKLAADIGNPAMEEEEGTAQNIPIPILNYFRPVRDSGRSRWMDGASDELQDWLYWHVLLETSYVRAGEIRVAVGRAFECTGKHGGFLALRYFMDYLDRTSMRVMEQQVPSSEAQKPRARRRGKNLKKRLPKNRRTMIVESYWEQRMKFPAGSEEKQAFVLIEAAFLISLLDLATGCTTLGPADYFVELDDECKSDVLFTLTESANPTAWSVYQHKGKLDMGRMVNEGVGFLDDEWQFPCFLHAVLERAVEVESDTMHTEYMTCARGLIATNPAYLNNSFTIPASWGSFDYPPEGNDDVDPPLRFDAAAYLIYARAAASDQGTLTAGYDQRMFQIIDLMRKLGASFDLALKYCFSGPTREFVRTRLGSHLPPIMVPSLLFMGANPNAIIPDDGEPPLAWSPLHQDFTSTLPIELTRRLHDSFTYFEWEYRGLDLIDKSGWAPLPWLAQQIAIQDPNHRGTKARIQIYHSSMINVAFRRKYLGMGKWTEAPQWDQMEKLAEDLKAKDPNLETQAARILVPFVQNMPTWELKPLPEIPQTGNLKVAIVAQIHQSEDDLGQLDIQAMDETEG